MHRWGPRSAGAAASALLLLATSCGPIGGGGTAREVLPPPDASAPATEPDPGPEPEASPEPPARPAPAPDAPATEDCEPVTRERITSTVATQVEAFAEEDFDAAYAMTSPFFRRITSREAFEALIRDGYPELVGNDGHRFDACQARNRRAFILVGVRSGADELVLRYDLSDEEDGWRIDGAIRVSGIGLPPQRQA